MNQKIMVTGGLGFIGGHLIKKLITEAYFPIIIDNLSNGDDKILKSFPPKKYIFIKCDITDKQKMAEIFTKFKPKTIIHLAAVHFIPYCDQNPSKTIFVNFFGTHLLLDLAIKNDTKNFLFASSAAIYKPSKYRHREDNPLEPIDIYGISKQLAEELINFYARTTDINSIILRLFNVYGPGDKTPHFIPMVLSRVEKSDRIRVGNLNTFRDYIYVGDVVEAIIKILKSNSGFNNFIYNIGTGKKYSGSSLIKIIERLRNKKILVNQDKKLMRKTDRRILVADISKFSREYLWEPKYGIIRGLKQLIKIA